MLNLPFHKYATPSFVSPLNTGLSFSNEKISHHVTMAAHPKIYFLSWLTSPVSTRPISSQSFNENIFVIIPHVVDQL